MTVHGPYSDTLPEPDIHGVWAGEAWVCANCGDLWTTGHYCAPAEDDHRSGMAPFWRYGR